VDFSSLFTHSEEFLFLNSGSLTRTPLTALAALDRYRREAEINPTKSLFDSYRLLWALQERLANALGAEAKDLYLRANITQALQDFIFAVPLPAEGEILVSEWEYGATSEIARERAKQSGLSFREAKFTPDESAADALIEQLSSQTRMVVFSHVLTATGLILPVEKIARAAKERGIVVVVDGAHAPGALTYRLKDFPSVDFYGGNFHKWFLGPRGTAFGWVHPDWDKKIPWKFSGWANRETPTFYQGLGAGSHEAARRFPSGTFDPSPFYALHEVLDFWQKYGAATIQSRQNALRDLCANRAEELGWQRVSPREPKIHGPLVAYRLPAGWDASDAVALSTRIYQETSVQLAIPKARGEAFVRFSPGVYSTEKEINLAFTRLAKLGNK
jgi:isopenicillin-N epimerase